MRIDYHKRPSIGKSAGLFEEACPKAGLLFFGGIFAKALFQDPCGKTVADASGTAESFDADFASAELTEGQQQFFILNESDGHSKQQDGTSFATEEMVKVYNTVLQAQLAGIAATKAGVLGKEVDAAARKVIADAGYGDFFGHGYGHCLGMEVHEAPNCNPGGERVMEENMISSAEPGIYLPGKFGVRIEDVLIFKEDGSENITTSPKNLIII